GEQGTQAGGEREEEQPQSERGGGTGADQHPDVVQGAFGELPGQFPAPGHGGPAGADGGHVVEEGARHHQEGEGQQGRGNTARGPQPPVPAGCLLGPGTGSGASGGLRVRPGVRGPAHRVLPRAAPRAAARCSRSTCTTTSVTCRSTRSVTRSVTLRRTRAQRSPRSPG